MATSSVKALGLDKLGLKQNGTVHRNLTYEHTKRVDSLIQPWQAPYTRVPPTPYYCAVVPFLLT